MTKTFSSTRANPYSKNFYAGG